MSFCNIWIEIESFSGQEYLDYYLDFRMSVFFSILAAYAIAMFLPGGEQLYTWSWQVMWKLE